MTKKFAVFDIDGTIFRSGLHREVVYELLAMDAAPQEIRDAFKDYEADWKKRKYADAFNHFEKIMAETFRDLLPSVRYRDFDKAVKRVFVRSSDHVYAYTRDLAAKLKKDGYMLIVISGSQAEIVKLFAKKYNFDIWVGQEYQRGDDGYFTGVCTETHQDKDLILKKLARKYKLSFKNSIAVGDSRGDISMLSIVEQPIAFNPDRSLFNAAKKHGWTVVVERKNMIYKLEPRENAFVLA